MIKIFVVSLKKDKTRRAFVTKQMAKMGIPFEFFDAIDGENLSTKQKLRVQNKNLSTSEIGCALSHADIYAKILHDKIERAIVLEDDGILNDDFKSMIDEKILEKSEENFIMLYHLHGYSHWWTPYKNLFAGYSLVKPVFTPKSTAGYYLTVPAAQKLYDATRTIQTVADYPINLQDVNVKCVVPRIVEHPSLEDSSIAQSREISIGALFRKIMSRHTRLYCVLANIYHLKKNPIASIHGIIGNTILKRLSPKVEGK